MKHTVSEISLKNGAKGLLIHIPDATVMCFEFNFRAGEYLVKPDKWETAHLMEHLLLGANERLPKARLFQAEIEKNGAYSNASTSVYDVTYEAECADFEWDRVLDLLHVAITKPLFLQEEFDAELGNVREELTARSNSHYRHLSLSLRQKYGFMAKTDQERLDLMSNVTIEDILEHYKRTHFTKNMRFVVAGNITPKRHDAILETMNNFDLPEGRERLALPDEKPVCQNEALHIYNKSVKNVYFYVDSFMVRRMNDDENYALGLVNTMLTETLYSKIFGTARERGLVYGMNSGLAQTKLTSNWWFGAQVSRKNAPALFDIMVEELQKVFAGKIAVADIEAAKAYSLGRFQRSAQTVSGTMAGYDSRYFFDDVIEDYFQFPKRIREVTKTQIVEIARELFAENIWGMGVLSNCDKELAEKLRTKIAPLWHIEEG
jgi:predicted Zn-dependent peptidase